MATVTSSESPTIIQPEDGKPTTKPNQSATRRARRNGRLRWGFAALVVAASVTYWQWPGSQQEGLAAETFRVKRKSFTIKLNEKGELEATKSVDVKCEVEGRSTIIWLIPEGTEVEEGELLVKIASNEIDERVRAEQIKEQNAKAAAEAADKELEIALDQHKSDIRKAVLALRNAEIELKKYTEGDHLQQLMDKELALQTARKTFAQKKGILKDSKELKDKKFLTPREYDERELQCDQAEVTLRKAELDLQIYKDYTHPKEAEQKRSDVEEAQKDLERTKNKSQAEESKLRATTAAKHAESELTDERLAKLLEQQQKTEIRAPAPGLVVYYSGRYWNRTQISEGAEVYERQTIIKLPDTSQMMVKLRIHESKTSEIAIGQSVTTEVEGVPGVTFTGSITKIAPLADSQNRWLNPDLKEYATEVTLDTNGVNLKPGVTARTEILVRQVDDVLVIPVQAVFSSGSHSYAFVGSSQSSAKPVEIKVGHSSDEYIEVRTGLSEGDVVLLAANEKLLAAIPSNAEDPTSTPQQPKPKKTTSTSTEPRP